LVKRIINFILKNKMSQQQNQQSRIFTIHTIGLIAEHLSIDAQFGKLLSFLISNLLKIVPKNFNVEFHHWDPLLFSQSQGGQSYIINSRDRFNMVMDKITYRYDRIVNQSIHIDFFDPTSELVQNSTHCLIIDYANLFIYNPDGSIEFKKNITYQKSKQFYKTKKFNKKFFLKSIYLGLEDKWTYSLALSKFCKIDREGNIVTYIDNLMAYKTGFMGITRVNEKILKRAQRIFNSFLLDDPENGKEKRFQMKLKINILNSIYDDIAKIQQTRRLIQQLPDSDQIFIQNYLLKQSKKQTQEELEILSQILNENKYKKDQKSQFMQITDNLLDLKNIPPQSQSQKLYQVANDQKFPQQLLPYFQNYLNQTNRSDYGTRAANKLG